MEIISVNKDNKDLVIKFLQDITLITDINEEVIMNGEFVSENSNVIGLLSFEEFTKIGLIRYFIFKKYVDHEIIQELFKRIINKAKNRNLETLITLVVKDEAIQVFMELGFDYVDKNSVYIEEVNINDTRFRDAQVLKYDLKILGLDSPFL